MFINGVKKSKSTWLLTKNVNFSTRSYTRPASQIYYIFRIKRERSLLSFKSRDAVLAVWLGGAAGPYSIRLYLLLNLHRTPQKLARVRTYIHHAKHYAYDVCKSRWINICVNRKLCAPDTQLERFRSRNKILIISTVGFVQPSEISPRVITQKFRAKTVPSRLSLCSIFVPPR